MMDNHKSPASTTGTPGARQSSATANAGAGARTRGRAAILTTLPLFLGIASLVVMAEDNRPSPVLQFYGYTTGAAETHRRAFLREGGRIFIAAEGDLIDERYRLIRIGEEAVVIEDVTGNSRRTLPLASADGNTNSAGTPNTASVVRPAHGVGAPQEVGKAGPSGSKAPAPAGLSGAAQLVIPAGLPPEVKLAVESVTSDVPGATPAPPREVRRRKRQ
jgi:hypothetical protein